MATKKEEPLSKVEKKRVEILKDALAQVKAEKYKVTTGQYIGGKFEQVVNNFVDTVAKLEYFTEQEKAVLGITTSVTLDDELQKHMDEFLTKKTPCEVCARGAILISDIRKNNNCSLGEVDYLDSMATKRSAEVFGQDNADKMECVFEDSNSYFTNYYKLSDVEQQQFEETIKLWNKTYPKATDRLVAIFKNAIKNRGIFKPEQLK